jgi:4-amino-4-deoxy-L-arabinose transferase-like glycosyltransferase
MLAVWLLGAIVLWRFAAALFGEDAGVGALLLYVLCPNLQAHGHLATLDVAAGTAILAAFFCLYRFLKVPSAWRLFATGVTLGLAVLVKFTALVTLPAFILLFFVAGGAAWRPGRAAARLGAVLAIALLVVNAGYGFRGTITRLGSYTPKSAFVRGLVERLPASLPVPLPRSLVEGFDSEKLITERGEFGTYLRGQWSRKAPWTYDAVAFLVKTPEPVLLLLALTLGGALLGRTGRRAPLLDEAFCWLPPLFLLVLFSAFNELKIGIRYLLPAYPFLFLGISRWFADFPRPRLRSLVAGAAVLALAVNAALVHGDELAYFNRIAGGPARGHEWLLDSNLDWGQDLGRVPEALRERSVEGVRLLYFGHVEPALYGIDYRLPGPRPEPGTYVVSVNFAVGASYVAPDHGRMVRVNGAPAWIRQLRPDGRIGRSLWVYDVR